MRTEKDFLGDIEIEDDVLYGIHSMRAMNNFPDHSPFNPEWYKAIGKVKQACYITAKNFFNEIQKKYKNNELKITVPETNLLDLLIESATEIGNGTYLNHFIVPAISGGAGTSINLNINEIISNVALIKAGKKPGKYHYIDPIEDANIFQSTNDVIPTGLKVATMHLLNKLEDSINNLRTNIEQLEKNNLNTLRIGYTQMQEAVPTSYGRLFSNYNDALSRDWWRVSKCFERIKVVNLGGSAIGTGITVPKYFIMNVVQELQKITGLPVTRGENLSDATSNLDSYAEVHAILKAHAVNLEKMTGDLRLLSSDILAQKEIEIPKKQTGSSIMPGKINPVIPEFVISCCHKIYANDQLITGLCAQGCLDLNAYLPVIGDTLLNSIELLINCNITIKNNLIDNLKINSETALEKLLMSTSVSTALIPAIGYNKASEIAKYMKTNKCSILDANNKLNFIANEKLKKFLKPENLLNQGYRIQDYID